MIAALVLVALVAAAGRAQAMPERLHEVQPFFELAGLRELGCLLNALPQLPAVLNKAAQHPIDTIAAVADIGKRLLPCKDAEDKLACTNKKLSEFLKAEHSTSVKEVISMLGVIADGINECCAY